MANNNDKLEMRRDIEFREEVASTTQQKNKKKERKTK
jgi:hypothetical protein